MATPLAVALKSAWPEASLDWAVDRHSRPALLGNPYLRQLIDATGVIRGQFHVRAYVRLWQVLRRGEYDAAFVPDRAPLLAMLPWLARIPERVGLDSGGRGWCHNVRVRADLDLVKPETELFLDLARAVGVPVGSNRPVFVPSREDVRSAEDLIAQLVPAGQGLVRIMAIHPAGGVTPGMTLMEKRWPAPRYAELARQVLAAGLADRIVLLGGPDDLQVGEEVIRECGGMEGRGHVHNVAGRLSLGATAALIARCRVFVGNDTGVAHLAMAVGTPAVVVFGPTDPRRYGPPAGMGVAVGPPPMSARRGAPAAAIDLRRAGGSTAIDAVSVPAVVDAVRAVMGR